MRDYVRHVHFVGVGGSGMSGIAEVLLNLGYKVSGSDLADGPTVRRLRDSGVDIRIGHTAENVLGSDVVVTSTAIVADNIEVVSAKAGHIPVIPRAEMLGELMRFRRGIAVAGTHGKTTTTSLVAAVLAKGGLDPTFVVGGLVNSVATNARLGEGDYLVAEADESDASFLHLQPLISIVTNIDADHLVTYGGSFQKLQKTFVDFIRNLPFYGLAVLCIDDQRVREIIPALNKPLITYGTSSDADIYADTIRQDGLEMNFQVRGRAISKPLDVTLSMPGEHNVLNALAAIAVASRLGVSDKAIIAGLAEFQGIGRRFQVRGELKLEQGSALLVDDYAHHPRELSATLAAAAAAWPDRRCITVFQPHRYSRTNELMDDFSQVLSSQESLIVTEVYPAGEAPVAMADGRALCRAIRSRGQVEPVFVEHLSDLPQVLAGLVRPGDIVLTLGAGDIGRFSVQLSEKGLQEGWQ
ncbi:MAG: UDP-N-acetylmuramate--L-alanine ligase [Arenicellales bacterium]|mgnify:FL=1|jgi:UDP-N-acetylmuramate--alanine ligase|nr:UDP-N-acetylmuramate--L-alanine ligase [Acidiferrobacteraceae bacterium]MDP6289744.1 UDP-N-acetylmuramate--L-alanine ligase [Arenicellales bacterium]MBT59007.1 UDP-N-acetylmuramate--L-alanine ligase [Acidiferrobacteraceae bacterium]MDP6435181.1 UDP-N-acetylmuramate--L-alanine ligase [Arenicellales bacterium]MDP6671539.1 UDP-N-acetylmuramate--L-alanine ligase [Arenicellales bacterium]|tara:strand:+ start:150 stop:1553 length:1404 start_codon:yes stop_codon:yes gene_type:complete